MMTKPDEFIKQAEEKGQNVQFLRFARERYSVRSFSDTPIEQHKIDSILTAAQLAPTAVNFQPQMIYVLKSEEALAKIRQVCRSTYGVPLVFLICSDERKTWKSQTERGYSSGEMDCSIVGTRNKVLPCVNSETTFFLEPQPTSREWINEKKKGLISVQTDKFDLIFPLLWERHSPKFVIPRQSEYLVIRNCAFFCFIFFLTQQ
ncbi:Nitroreductase family protein [Kandleria vitulina]|uniref:nitroreductase family protein n=1 Tax=Kandleria vitulina TaxID=1630 RepID=UPI000886A202|nr:nitroreductase family protein [Kandleria vitulina]SDL41346.1 Nitroreductase family protein [Kandleria vitulina]